MPEKIDVPQEPMEVHRKVRDAVSAMIRHNGNYDRASYNFSPAKMALATGIKVHALFTFGALRSRLMADRPTGRGIGEEIRRMLEKGLAKGNISQKE